MIAKKIKFINTLNRPYPPFYLSLIMDGYRSKKIFYDFFGTNHYIPDIKIIAGDWFYPEYHMISFRNWILGRLVNNKTYFLELKRKTLQRERLFNQDIKKNLRTFCRAYRNYTPALALYFIMDDVLESAVKDLLLEKSDAKKVNSFMPLLTSPLQDNFDRRSKIYLLKTKSPVKFLKQYGWLNSRYGILNEYTLEKAQELLKELKKDNYLQKYQANRKRVLQAIAEAKKIIGPQKAYLIDVIQFFIYYRTHRTDMFNKAPYYFAPQLKLIATKNGLSYNDCLFCTASELLNNKIPKLSIIHDRQKGFSFVSNPEGSSFLINNKHQELLKKYDNKVNNNLTEITGRVAYPGKVQGRIRIIRKTADLSRLKKDEILTTSMTTTDMISAIKKAAAFITDEGGITCHAAIIARELKKPCIIGTKIATRILKDNDLVEIDANNGIVKIIG
ncbi:MAG: PEP-utilizing enzyme [Patescibacteria group bacterium]